MEYLKIIYYFLYPYEMKMAFHIYGFTSWIYFGGECSIIGCLPWWGFLMHFWKKELRQTHSKFFVVFTKALIKREFQIHSVKVKKAWMLTLTKIVSALDLGLCSLALRGKRVGEEIKLLSLIKKWNTDSLGKKILEEISHTECHAGWDWFHREGVHRSEAIIVWLF